MWWWNTSIINSDENCKEYTVGGNALTWMFVLFQMNTIPPMTSYATGKCHTHFVDHVKSAALEEKKNK